LDATTTGSALYADDDTARVVIPSDAGVINIPANETYTVEQIAIKGTYDPNHFVEINIGNNSTLVIESRNIIPDPGAPFRSVLQIDAEANVKFTGTGRVVLKTALPVGNPGAIAEYRVRGNATVDFQVRVVSPLGVDDADTTTDFGEATAGLYGFDAANAPFIDPTQMIKTETGKLYFTGNVENSFAGRDNDTVENFFQILVQDGEFGLAGPGNFTGPNTSPNGVRRINFSDNGVTSRTPTFTALWSGSKSVGTNFQISAETKYGSSGAGTIKVAQADGVLNINTSGSAPNNGIGTINGATIAGAGYDGAIAKAGPGTLRVSAMAGVVDKIGSISVDEGTLRLSANGALDNIGIKDSTWYFDDGYFDVGMVSVFVADGATFRVDADVIENIDGFDGEPGSRTIIEETARLNTWGGGTYEGQLTNSGSIGVVRRTLEITGHQNDFSGDTHVSRGGTILISHSKNLGGTRENSIYLEADFGHTVGYQAASGGLLEVAEGSGNLVLPNRIYLGNGIKLQASAGSTATDVDRNRNVGESRIRVWKGDRLELPSNIQYNANTLFKFGEGDLYLTGLGYDSTGANTFTITNGKTYTGGTPSTSAPNNISVVENPPTVTTALRIFNGMVRIENRYAVDHGDIITDAGQQPARRPVLSIGNGIEFANHLLFTDAAALATELKTENLTSGTNVQSAIGVGYFTTPTDRTEVRVRVAFSELEGGVVHKGDNFQLVKSLQFIRVDENMIVPEQWDAMGSIEKAPFDPRLSASGILFFEANTNIDIPQIGSPNVTEVAFGEPYTIRIPVQTTTGLMDNSAELSGPLFTSGAKIAISGSELVITGTAPAAASEDLTLSYNVAVTSKTDRTSDTVGYAQYKQGLALKVTANPGGGGEQPTGPNVTGAVTVDVAAQTLTAKVSYTFDGDAAATPAEIRLYKGAPVGGELLATVTDAVITATDGYTLTLAAADAAAGADFKYEYDTTYTAQVTVAATGHAPWEITGRQASPVTPDPSRGGSGGGCDAGFGLFGLLAATGAVTLLRRKG
jgi:hypothetical protein